MTISVWSNICILLVQIFAIVRDQKNPQQFSVEYVKGAIRTYTSTDRDALIASVLDGVRASGNRDVCVKMKVTGRGMRLGTNAALVLDF